MLSHRRWEFLIRDCCLRRRGEASVSVELIESDVRVRDGRLGRRRLGRRPTTNVILGGMRVPGSQKRR